MGVWEPDLVMTGIARSRTAMQDNIGVGVGAIHLRNCATIVEVARGGGGVKGVRWLDSCLAHFCVSVE